MPKRRSHNPLPPVHRTRGVADIMLMRSIVGFIGAWEACRPACRRHKRCASPMVECFDLNREAIRAHLTELNEWRRLDGPREPDELTRPIATLFD
jgi:hypothetical protein